MKNVKREMNMYSIYDRQGLQKHLEEMAAKGWMLDKMGQYIWYYRRTEPKKLRFAVSYFSSASVFDPSPSEKQETYREFCEHAGWKLAGAFAQMEIYWNEDENAVPLVTDPLVEIETIHKTAKKTIILSNILLLVIALMNIWRTLNWYKSNTISALLSDSNFWSLIAFGVAGLWCGIELFRYFTWYFQAKKIAEREDRFLETKSSAGFTKGALGLLLVMFLYVFISFMLEESILVGLVIIGYTFLIFAIVLGIRRILKDNNVSTKVNRIVTLISCYVVTIIVTSCATIFIFRNIEPKQSYEREAPLCVQDLTLVDEEGYLFDVDMKESSALSELTVIQDNLQHEEAPILSYAILDVKIPKLYDICIDYFLREAGEYNSDIEYREVEVADWSTDKVYQMFNGAEHVDTYLLCYENKIVRVSFYNFDTNETLYFAKIVSEKLKPN